MPPAHVLMEGVLGDRQKETCFSKNSAAVEFVFLQVWGDGRKFHSRTDQALTRSPKTLRIKPSRKKTEPSIKTAYINRGTGGSFCGFFLC